VTCEHTNRTDVVIAVAEERVLSSRTALAVAAFALLKTAVSYAERAREAIRDRT
jgi:hypothetical protein